MCLDAASVGNVVADVVDGEVASAAWARSLSFWSIGWMEPEHEHEHKA